MNQPLYFLGYLTVNAIQMGANIDYAIVISSHYQELKKEMPYKEAIVQAVNAAFPTIFTSGTIMASAGAQSDHLNHVSTQLPYAMTVAGISFVTYVIAGLLAKSGLAIVALPIGIVLTIAVLLVIKKISAKKA